jgi:hypothetical protein
LEGVGVSNADEVAWGTVNLLDADRVPQGATDTPWAERYCCEAVPLINEIVVQSASGAVSSNIYEVAVELWYPFVSESADETFTLQVGIFRDEVTGVAELAVMQGQDPNWSFTAVLDPMSYGGASEFQTVQTPDAAARISFTVPSGVGGGVADLPLGVYVDPVTGAAKTNDFYLLVRVLDSAGKIVDEAPGYTQTGLDTERAMLHVMSPGSYEVNDPRDNGRLGAWHKSATAATLGTSNTAFSVSGDWQGLPIVHLDRPLHGVWELGQLYDPASGPWQNLNLLGGTHSAAGILDRLAVTNVAAMTEPWRSGRINVNTRSTNVLQALFQGVSLVLPPGYPGGTNQIWHPEAAGIDAFAGLVMGSEMHSSVGALFSATPEGEARGAALRQALPTNSCPTLDYLEEQIIGRAAESMTFRQNLFVVIAVAQSTNLKGNRSQAEVRIMALIYRDAWTGNWFIKDWREI